MDNPITYIVVPVDRDTCRLYTEDTRVGAGDNDITVANDKLINMMGMMTEVLKDEGYAVVFVAEGLRS